MIMKEQPNDHRSVEEVSITEEEFDDNNNNKDNGPKAVVKKPPNLFQEVQKAMGDAFLMFALADIRDMAKNGDLQGDPILIEKLINLPIDAYDFITIYRENREIIQKQMDSKERYEMYESFFHIPKGKKYSIENENYLRSIQFIHFEDENKEEECVYALIVNHIQKKVTVSFRGSVTSKDFIQDAKAFFTPIPNPVKLIDDAAKEEVVDPLLIPRVRDNVHVHLGFREYLYGEVPFNFKKFVKKIPKATVSSINHISNGSNTLLVKAKDTIIPESLQRSSKEVMTSVLHKMSDSIRCSANKKGMLNITKKTESKKEMTVEEYDVEEGVMISFKEEDQDNQNEQEEINNESDDIDNHVVNNNDDNDCSSNTTTMKKRYEVILEMASATLKENPGYSFYINGHSLGGALATMLAFEAAASDDDVIPKPVTCITSGAPKVGNLDYLHSFEVLEEQRKIRYLRVANFRDLVPLSPPNQTYDCLSAIFCQNRRFRHVGIRLKLFPHGYVITYPPKTRTCPGIWICDFIKIIRHYLYLVLICPVICFCKNQFVYKAFRSEHTQLVYMDRLTTCSEDLSNMYLDDLYEERIHRSRMRLPTLHGSTHALRNTDVYKQDPSKFFTAILEV